MTLEMYSRSLVRCSDEARVPRYLCQASGQHALCPKAHGAESEGVLRLRKFLPSLSPPFPSRAQERSLRRVWLRKLMAFSTLAFWDLGWSGAFLQEIQVA